MRCPPVPSNACSPEVTIVLAAFLALAAFSGFLAAEVAIVKFREFRERRLRAREMQIHGERGPHGR